MIAVLLAFERDQLIDVKWTWSSAVS